MHFRMEKGDFHCHVTLPEGKFSEWSRWYFQTCFFFNMCSPLLGKIAILTTIFWSGLKPPSDIFLGVLYNPRSIRVPRVTCDYPFFRGAVCTHFESSCETSLMIKKTQPRWCNPSGLGSNFSVWPFGSKTEGIFSRVHVFQCKSSC